MGMVSHAEFRTYLQKTFATANVGRTLNATTTEIAFPFSAPRTGNITKIGFATGTVTSSQSVTAGIYSIDGSGNPGTISGATGEQGTIASNTAYEITLGTPAPVTHHSLYFPKFFWTSTAGTAVLRSYAVTGVGDAIPYVGTYASSTWTRNASERLACWVYYDDGLVYPINSSPFLSVSGATNISTGTTPSEIANHFAYPFPVRLIGAEFLINQAAAADLDIIVYSGTTALSTHSHLAIHPAATGGGQRWSFIHFPDDLDFDVNEEFRIAIKPTTATASTYIKWTVGSNAVLGGLPGGINCYASSRSGSAEWSNDTASFYSMIPVFGAFSNGGMLIHSGMTGGLSA